MQARLRQVARLERLVVPYLMRKEQSDVDTGRFVAGIARTKLANIALLSLYGKPRMTKSLENAWQRCRKSSAWKACRARHPDFGDYNRDDNTTPFERYPAKKIAAYFERHFLPELPGADEREKFELIFRRVPSWLLWFTYADVNAHVLGVKIQIFPGRCSLKTRCGSFAPTTRTTLAARHRGIALAREKFPDRGPALG